MDENIYIKFLKFESIYININLCNKENIVYPYMIMFIQ